MEAEGIRTLMLRIFKTLNKLNPAFTEEIFYRKKWLTHGPKNIKVNVHKTAKYGCKCLRTLDPHI